MMNAERKKAAFEVNKFSKLATEHVNKNELDQAIHYFHSAYNSSEIMNVHSTIQSCAFNLGAAYVANGDGQNGILYLQKALPPEGLGDPTSYGDLYYNLVLAYELINDRGQMKTFLEKSLQCISESQHWDGNWYLTENDQTGTTGNKVWSADETRQSLPH